MAKSPKMELKRVSFISYQIMSPTRKPKKAEKATREAERLRLDMSSLSNSLDFGGCGEDVAYP